MNGKSAQIRTRLLNKVERESAWNIHRKALAKNLKSLARALGIDEEELDSRIGVKTSKGTGPIGKSMLKKLMRAKYPSPAILVKLMAHQKEGRKVVLKTEHWRILKLDSIFRKVYGCTYEKFEQLLAGLKARGGPSEDQLLPLPLLSWDSDRYDPLSRLLRPECLAVKFHGRTQAMKRASHWIEDSCGVLLRLYYGQGGVGKTRFGLRICQDMVERGSWVAGFLDDDISEGEWNRILSTKKNVLVVVDDADTKSGLVERIYAKIRNAKARPGKVRFILLARDPWEWWSKLGKKDDVNHVPILDVLKSEEELCELESDLATAFQTAVAGFAKKLGKKSPAGVPRGLDAPELKRVLFLHIKALAFVRGDDVNGEDDLLDWVMTQENSCWERHLEHNQLTTRFAKGMKQAMAAITEVQGAVTEEDGLEAVKGLSGFNGLPEINHQTIVDILHLCYPAKELWIGPLAPDSLGLRLVHEYLGQPKIRNEINRLTLGIGN